MADMAQAPETLPAAPPPRRRARMIPALLAVALTATVVEGVALVRIATDHEDTPTTPVASVVRTSGGEEDLSGVIANSMRSVVAVEVTATRPGPFGQPVQVGGQGSGVIVRDGVVLTNAHVVDGATQVSVVFDDETHADASVLGSDSTHDIAVLSVDTGDRPPIEIGSSSSLRLGQRVVALGYPLLARPRPPASYRASTGRSTCRTAPAARSTSSGSCRRTRRSTRATRVVR